MTFARVAWLDAPAPTLIVVALASVNALLAHAALPSPASLRPQVGGGTNRRGRDDARTPNGGGKDSMQSRLPRTWLRCGRFSRSRWCSTFSWEAWKWRNIVQALQRDSMGYSNLCIDKARSLCIG